MNRGYVKLWRKSLDSGLIKNHKLWVFWTYCLMKATHKKHDAVIGYQTIHIMPGQFVFGRKKASLETGLTEQEIRTAVASMISSKNITIKPTNKYSIITIINWDIYQSEGKEDNHQTNQQLTNKQPTTNHIQECKECKERDVEHFKPDSDEYRLASLLYELIKNRNPKHKKPNLQAWAKDINKIIRIDKRDPSHIEKIIKICQQDTPDKHEFEKWKGWANNILSTKTLRDKYDKLIFSFKQIPIQNIKPQKSLEEILS